ncbi:MAG: class I SAM-dependent methyltransferase [Leifsonia sp.]
MSEAVGRGIDWLRPLARGELRRRDASVTELMDAPDCDTATLERTYAGFPYVNAVFSGWRATYVRYIRPRLSTTIETRILDVGSGGGDLTRRLGEWARRDGLRTSVLGIDPDARATAYARRQPAVAGVEFRAAYTSDLVAAGERFDLVVSNHVLHHLTGEQLGALLADSERLAPRSLHGDITRSAFAYWGFGMLTWPLFARSYIRPDGLASIRRSHTPADLQGSVPPGWLAFPQDPTRYLLTWSSDG